MIHQKDNLTVRRATERDAGAIVGLFCEDGSNSYGWDEKKWRHYYLEYPEGESISLVAEIDGSVVGHYGMVPVRIFSRSGMLGMHAYVSKKYRGLTVISALMKVVDETCVYKDMAFICGFANPNFALIKKTFFKWNIPFWLGTVQNTSSSDLPSGQARFYFQYSDEWFIWRFGTEKLHYVSNYVDQSNNVHKQLLKARMPIQMQEVNELADTECWSPAGVFPSSVLSSFRQPFSLKIYDSSLYQDGVMDGASWHVEMGDSDSFIYTPWSS